MVIISDYPVLNCLLQVEIKMLIAVNVGIRVTVEWHIVDTVLLVWVHSSIDKCIQTV